MLDVHVEMDTLIAVIEPHGKLTTEDFLRAAAAIDPVIEEHGRLNGLIVYSKAFPGWDSFNALLSHLTFVQRHHEKVTKVALVTDSGLATVMQALAGHFVNAEIKRFPYQNMDQARAWLLPQSAS